jgi:predicted methyltransferase
MRHLLAAPLAIAMLASAVPAVAQKAAIAAAVANPARPAAERARDTFRHPVETLDFFGVKANQTVIEYSPGGGWYTRILMPLLADKGSYVAVVGNTPRAIEGATKLVAGLPGSAKAKVVPFDPDAATMGAPASADRVLTFRNVHNMLMAGADNGKGDAVAAAWFKAAFKVLKPGGMLGVVDHRLPESADAEREKKSGYVKRSTVVRLATAAGFTLAGESQVNANPKDTADWPDGVWTLPPTLAKKDVDRAKYVAIGESDRMTLRFVKR